jgi:transposase
MARTRSKRTVLTDEQRRKIAAFLAPQDMSKGGRPRRDPYLVLEGIIWVLVTGSQWWALPDEYPSPATCWRWLDRWQREGVWEKIEQALLGELDDRGGIKWEECFADATFAPAKKGAPKSARPARGKARR